ncbi:MAG: lamin tail domain-containing protein, partial [Pirellulales bacterium]
TGVADVQPGFSVRMIDTSSGGIWDLATATNLLNGNTAGYTVACDTTTRYDAIAFEDDLYTTPFPCSVDREQYAMRIATTLTIPAGTWTLAFGVGLAGTFNLPGVAVGPPTVSGAFNLFVLSVGAATNTTLTLDLFETTRTDWFDIRIAPGNQGTMNAAFGLLRDGQYGWQVTTTAGDASFNSAFATDLGSAMFNLRSSLYLRAPFEATNVSNVIGLTLSMQYDDGFVAYLNNVEVARRNAPGGLTFNSAATALRADSDALRTEWIDLSEHVGLLVNGTNVLAIHGLNQTAASTDFLLVPTLEAVYAPTPIAITGSTLINARALVGGVWSPLTQSQFSVAEPAAAGNFAITEVHYHPADPTPEELAVNPLWTENDFEFMEFRNIGAQPIDLSGVALVRGISFTFPSGSLLDPGELAVIARNSAALTARYGIGLAILGQYSGSLSNAGEQITLVDAAGGTIHDFAYGDSNPWPSRADGGGASLEVIDYGDDYQNPTNYNSSDEYGGSPGAVGTGPIDDVVINEVLAHSGLGMVDAIELLNVSAADIDVGGWYLSDSTNYKRFRIPDETILAAGGYLVLDESDFNPTPALPGPNVFALDGAHGEDVWLMEASAAGKLLRFVDDVSFDAAALNSSLGRWPNGAGSLYPMSALTLGGPNSGPRIGPVMISEIAYNHSPSVTDDALEFIELTNLTGGIVDLGGWRFDAGVAFELTPGTTLPALGSLVVVPFNPSDPASAALATAFRTAYGIGMEVTLVGGYFGVLDNGGETVRLVRPDVSPPDEPFFTPYVLVDEVRYDDDAPWPATADGGGHSLTRNSAAVYGREISNWRGATPTPGSVDTSSSYIVGRRIFYNGSAWDGGDANANAGDDAAIATDKQALLPGQTAGFAHYISSDDGITGIMIDVANLGDAGSVSAGDFEFRFGREGNPALWPLVSAPANVNVRVGAGDAGSDRVSIVWAAGELDNGWLRVSVKATANTGLTAADTHYWGSAVGEAGVYAGDARVDFADRNAILANASVGPVAISNPYDINRDRVVDAADAAIVDANLSGATGDLDHDERVGLADLALLRFHLGGASVNSYDGDLNGDENVSRSDAALLALSFGSQATPAMLARRLPLLAAPAGSPVAASSPVATLETDAMVAPGARRGDSVRRVKLLAGAQPRRIAATAIVDVAFASPGDEQPQALSARRAARPGGLVGLARPIDAPVRS